MAEAKDVIQVHDASRLLIGKSLEYFIDSTNSLRVDELQHKSFTPCQDDVLNLGNISYTVWIRFAVANQTQDEVFLEVDAPC
jgi:hypothetical protein